MCIQLYSHPLASTTTSLPHQRKVVPTRHNSTFRQELLFLVSHSDRVRWNLEHGGEFNPTLFIVPAWGLEVPLSPRLS